MFSSAIAQYFICSLLAIRVEPEGTVDVAAYFEQERPAIFTAAAVFNVIGLLFNFSEGSHVAGQPSSWAVADIFLLPILALALLAGWARPKWLQWAAALITLVMAIAFFHTFTIRR